MPSRNPMDPRHPITSRLAAKAIVRGNRRHWVVGIAAGAIALAALVIGSTWGQLSTAQVDPKVIAWTSAGAILVFGSLATSRLARALNQQVSSRSLAPAGGAIRILTGAVGIIIVVFSVLSVLQVTIGKLLVGVGLAGVILGIAAQQSLGNIFAGLVLIAARPFRIGDHVRIRSGALGGIFDAWVREMSLTYVTLQTPDGELKVPNSGMLAAAVGPVPPGTPLPSPPPPAPPVANVAATQAPAANVTASQGQADTADGQRP